jgi:hypothetical protein
MSLYRREMEQVTDDSACDNYRGIFRHVDASCWTYFDTLNKAQALYMNSMRIPLDRQCDSEAARDGAPLLVRLRIDLQHGAVAQTLSIQVAPDFVKHFAFRSGAEACGIPCSPKRLTSVSFEVFRDGEQVTGPGAQSFVCDKRVRKSTPVLAEATLDWSPDAYAFCTVLTLAGYKQTLNFPCYMYEADECTSSWASDFSVGQAFNDFKAVLHQPCLTPSSRSLTVLSAVQAEARVATFESTVSDIHSVFDAVFADTVRQELGADGARVAAVRGAVDWRRSYTVTPDERVSELIRHTKDMYTQLSVLSNTAVKSCWMRDPAVQSLLTAREQLVDSVKGRRSRTDQVLDVRAAFICVDAIDSVLRSACGCGDGGAHGGGDGGAHGAAASPEQSLNHPALLEIPCHEYWLQQLECNTHNSIPLAAETHKTSRAILKQCRAVRESAAGLMPPSAALLSAPGASTLGAKIWQNMHLQGLAAQHALVVAPAQNFVYKRRGFIDFTKHPVVRSLVAQAATTSDRDKQLRLEKQIGPVALLTKLVTMDAEHRIIPHAVATHILALLERATAPAAAQESRQEASEFMMRVFEPKLHSLVQSALGATSAPDLSFVTDPDSGVPGTGYDMEQVTSFCLQKALSLQGL